MARADLLKKLFRSFKLNDKDGFINAAELIIDEEKKKNHVILANELKKILYSENSVPSKSISVFQPQMPKDMDKNSNLFEVKFPNRYFDDLVVKKSILENLSDIVRDFNFRDVLISNGLKPNNKILFCGPPGCGKTISAQAVAGELGLPLLYVRFDAVVSSYLGETSTNIRKVFDFASNDSWVIFFDEFDAIGRSRDDSSEHGEIKRVVNAFLQLIDNFSGNSIIIAATNYEQSLDKALWRRFSEVIRFDLPSSEEILRLLKKCMSRFSGPEHILEEMAHKLNGYSHSEIEKICQDVLKRCILEGRKYYKISDIEEAYKKEEERRKVRLSI